MGVTRHFAKAAILALVTLAACNTVEGMGEDVESVGEATQDAVD